MRSFERRVSSRKPRPPGTKIFDWNGRSAPPDSVRLMIGSRFWAQISMVRPLLMALKGLIEPPLMVGSLAVMTHSTPDTTPMPETMLPPRAKSVPQAQSGAISRNGESRSSSSSMRSRAMSLPRSRWRLTYFSPPPALASASCSFSVAICWRNPSRFSR